MATSRRLAPNCVVVVSSGKFVRAWSCLLDEKDPDMKRVKGQKKTQVGGSELKQTHVPKEFLNGD